MPIKNKSNMTTQITQKISTLPFHRLIPAYVSIAKFREGLILFAD